MTSSVMQDRPPDAYTAIYTNMEDLGGAAPFWDDG